MSFSTDLVAVPTSAPSIDFVSALSGEQGCDVCHELHASVYELRCSTCESAICPDCARLRADTSMACVGCYDRHPVRIFESGRVERPRQLALASLKESAASLRDAAAELVRRVRSGDGLVANRRLAVLTLFVLLRERVQGLAHSRHGRIALVRWREVAVPASRRAAAFTRALLVHARRLAIRARAATRDAVLQAWLTLRSLPVRHHSRALLLALLILCAVARAEQREA